MSKRRANIAILIVYWLAIPAGVFHFLFNRMGYPIGIAGLFAGILVVVPLLALPSLLKQDAAESSATTTSALSPKVGWGVFAVFMLLMVAVVAYFVITGR